jgi:hypothetical protein
MAGQAADLEEFAGDLAAAQTSWEAGWAFFERLGDRAHAAYFAAGAARLAALRELDGDAERWLERARSSAPDARHGAGTTALVAEAMLLRRQGDLATAEERIREAMSMAAFGRTGQGAAEPELRLLLASVLRRRGAVAEADAELHAAAESATAWGTLPTHDRIEAALADPGWPHDPPSGSAGRPAEAPDDADPAS